MNAAKTISGNELNMDGVPDSVWVLCMVIRQHTKDNDHNGAVKDLAARFGHGLSETNVLEAIATITHYEETTPRDLVELRKKILKGLLAKAEEEMNAEEYQAIKKSIYFTGFSYDQYTTLQES